MKIMIVEHDRNLLNSLERFYLSLNHQVMTCFDGVIAVNNFEDDVDLLVIDINVPRISYLETIELLKKKKEKLITFLILDTPNIDNQILLDSKMIDEFYSLPFTAEELRASIQNIDLLKDDYGVHLTIKERIILKELKDKSIIQFKDINHKIFKSDEIYQYIESINAKLTKQRIALEEKGFKLVNKND